MNTDKNRKDPSLSGRFPLAYLLQILDRYGNGRGLGMAWRAFRNLLSAHDDESGDGKAD
jgi:hypothetical protein